MHPPRTFQKPLQKVKKANKMTEDRNMNSYVLMCLLHGGNDQCSHHIETSQLICTANQQADFYMMGTLVVKGLMSLLP